MRFWVFFRHLIYNFIIIVFFKSWYYGLIQLIEHEHRCWGNNWKTPYPPGGGRGGDMWFFCWKNKKCLELLEMARTYVWSVKVLPFHSLLSHALGTTVIIVCRSDFHYIFLNHLFNLRYISLVICSFWCFFWSCGTIKSIDF